MLSRDNPPTVTFTSASTVRGFAAAMGDFDPLSLVGACIGEQTRAAAELLDIPTITAEKATMDALIQVIEDHTN